MGELFRCIRCNHVDIEDLARSEALQAGIAPEKHVCTRCLTGRWHNEFPFSPYNPETDQDVVNPPVP